MFRIFNAHKVLLVVAYNYKQNFINSKQYLKTSRGDYLRIAFVSFLRYDDQNDDDKKSSEKSSPLITDEFDYCELGKVVITTDLFKLNVELTLPKIFV